jgi:hypothetical protein
MNLHLKRLPGSLGKFASSVILVVSVGAMTLSSWFFPLLAAQATGQCVLNSSLQVQNGNPQLAGTIGYLLAAKNMGKGSCSSASVSVYYANQEKFVSASPRPTAGGYYWRLGNLAPGKEVDISITTSRSADLVPGDSVAEECLSANNGSDACSDAVSGPSGSLSAPTSTAVQTPTVPTSTTSTDPLKFQESGIWEWNTPTMMSVADMQTAVNEVSANSFNAIYLTIDDYLTIDALPAGSVKSAALTNYQNLVNTFLSLAAQKGISVDAEAGSRDWADPINAWKATDIINFVANYNSSHTIKFRGVQFDVEPYLLPSYTTDPAGVLTQYAQWVENIVNQDKNLGLPLSLDIPHFYDDVVQWTPEITIDGITSYPYNQILRLLNEIPNSSILIMAYRNFAVGPNGTIDISQTEVHEADGTGVKIIVGQETGNVDPSYVTFYGGTKAQLYSQMAIVKQTFASDSSFGGMAVDYLDPFMALQ